MTAKEIDELARHKQDIPDTADIIETGLYHKLFKIYSDFDEKTISAATAKAMKNALYEQYEIETGKDTQISELMQRIEQHMEIFKHDDAQRVKLSPIMNEANQHGCEICKRIAKVYDGRE